MKSFVFSLCMLPTLAWGVVQDVSQSSQLDVSVTLYPHEVALIKEKRKALLKMGSNKLLIKDVPSLILMETFLFQVLSPSPPLEVLDYSFRSSRITREELLRRSIGAPVLLFSPRSDIPPRNAQLLSLDGEDAIVDSMGMIFAIKKDEIGFPHLPRTLVPEPLIALKVKASQEGISFFELGYLSKGFSWEASYTIIVDPTEEHLDLHNWIALHNKSGVGIRKGHFRITDTQATYTIEHPVSLADQATKNISWFTAKNLVPIKNFCIFPKNNILLNEEGLVMKPAVETWLSVKNETSTGLGTPLPKGSIEVFKRSADGNLLYVGENKTSSIPLNHSLSLRLGTTKDVTAEMRQTDYRKLGNQVVESGYRLDLKNMTDYPKQVTIVQDVSGDWIVLRETHPHEEEEKCLRWAIPLAPQESVSLRYRIRMNLQSES